jgi:ketosteroid isomerase-like protein
MATPATPKPGEILKDVVQRLTTLFVDAFNKQDIDSVLSFYAADAVMLGPDHPGVKGKAAIRELLKSMIHTGYSSLMLGRNSMAHLGDLAVDIGYYTANTAGREREVGKREENGKYVTAWRRQPNGEFLITVTVWSTNM